jgi:hypothetical protein
MSTEELTGLREHLLERAKEDLIKEGRVVPASFLVVRKMGIPPNVRAVLRKMMTWETMNDDEAATNPADKVCLIVPNNVGPTYLLEMLPMAMQEVQFEKGKFEPDLVEVLRASAVLYFKTEDPNIIDEKVWKAVQSYLNLTEKDVLSYYLRHLCKVTEAEAVLKVDEVFFKMKEVPNGVDPADVDVPQNLSKDPSSQEGVMCSLETGSIQSMVILKFSRDGENKPTNFERVEMGGPKDPKTAFDGRFMNLIKRETTPESSA